MQVKNKNFNFKMNFVPAGTDPDGPSGMVAPPQVFAGKPDAYLDIDDLEFVEVSLTLSSPIESTRKE